MKLIEKIIITGKIKVETGLHIGGSSTLMNIGETDLNVIKSPLNQQPIIPGSSLKGKLRNMLAKVEGSPDVKQDPEYVREIFGSTEEKKGYKEGYVTRLIVRDCSLTKDSVQMLVDNELENKYTEVKWENTINRIKGGAEHPRQLERVPAGAAFSYEMILDVYDEDHGKDYYKAVEKAMNLLEDDYLGGSGTRGYGKVKFVERKMNTKKVEDYAYECHPVEL
jgi:CRISPR-associated protein Csm3